MKNIYLENTSNNHDKFYHMIENKDGASFTATWGRTGSNGRTQIYSMSEWDKIYNSKINKGYKSQYHNNPSKDKNKIASAFPDNCFEEPGNIITGSSVFFFIHSIRTSKLLS